MMKLNPFRSANKVRNLLFVVAVAVAWVSSNDGTPTSKNCFLLWQYDKHTGSDEEPTADEKTSRKKQVRVCVVENLELSTILKDDKVKNFLIYYLFSCYLCTE